VVVSHRSDSGTFFVHRAAHFLQRDNDLDLTTQIAFDFLEDSSEHD